MRVEETSAARGTIYDREHRKLAVSIESRSIYANPRQIRDPVEAALRLGGILDLDIDRLRDRLDSDSTFVFVARQVEADQAAGVEELDLAGIHFLVEPKRVYPSGVRAAHTVGFVDIDSKGIEGLESQYDELLTGIPGRVLAERAPGATLSRMVVTKCSRPFRRRPAHLARPRGAVRSLSRVPGTLEKRGRSAATVVVLGS